MCGIVAAALKTESQSFLLEGLSRLEYRGYDSAGIALHADQGLERFRAVGTVDKLAELVPERGQSRTGIGHTRWATHGGVNTANAHPHFSQNRVAVVHNGIIENHAELRTELKTLGYQFDSETDTEVIAHLLNHTLRQFPVDQVDQAIGHVLSRIEGSFALAFMVSSEPDVLYIARQKSPLLLGRGKAGHYAASDVLAVSGYVDEIAYLDDGAVLRVKHDGVEVLAGAQLTFQPVPKLEAMTSLGDWPHYMAREIYEQPQVLLRQLNAGMEQLDPALFGPAAQSIFKDIENILFVGAGTSYNAGMVGQYWVEDIAKVSARVELSSELRTRNIVLPKNTLVVALSQSGETADTLEALRSLRRDRPDLRQLALCNVPTSSLVRESDLYFPMQAGPEVSVASTKAFCAQVLAMNALAYALGQAKGTVSRLQLAAARKELSDLSHSFESSLAWAKDSAAALAPALDGIESAFFLGRGALYPLAMEAALKLKEVTYLHAEAFAAGELKHGPLAMMSPDRPVICFVADNGLAPKVLSSVQEVQARGAPVLLCAPKADKEAHAPVALFESAVKNLRVDLPAGGTLSQTLSVMMLGQFLAYACAVRRGLNPDRPRNLAKSVTVE